MPSRTLARSAVPAEISPAGSGAVTPYCLCCLWSATSRGRLLITPQMAALVNKPRPAGGDEVVD